MTRDTILLTFERDTDAQFAADTTLFTGTTISNGIATVANGKLAWDVALPVKGVAHIRVSNTTAANACGLDIESSNGKRIRFVFKLSNNIAQVYDGTVTTDISLAEADINLAQPFDIIVQDTGSNINYWFAQTTDETYAITATYGYPTSGATNRTAIWSSNANNIMEVDFIRLYTPDFGTPFENIINNKYFKLLETSGELTTEANDAQYDLPLNGAVLYKFDGFAAATTITLSNTARNGGLYIAFNQNSGNQIQVNHRENNSNPHISIASSSVVDTTKPFELLVVTSEETAEYFVKPYGERKFTSLGEYALPLGTQRATSNTADVISMTIYKYSNAPIVLTAGDDTAEVITNGTATDGAVRVLFNNNMAAKGKTVIFVGLTNEGAVKEGDFETRIIQENEEMIYLTDFASSTIKVFFWDNLVDMTPVDGFAPVIFKK